MTNITGLLFAKSTLERKDVTFFTPALTPRFDHTTDRKISTSK